MKKGAVAELISAEEYKYKCLFFNKENDTDALRAKFSDLIKSQYNYNKDLIDSFDSKSHPEKFECTVSGCSCSIACEKNEFWVNDKVYFTEQIDHICQKLYFNYDFDSPFITDSNYDVSARFLTVLIFSIFILLCHCGLICSGFMLMKEA